MCSFPQWLFSLILLTQSGLYRPAIHTNFRQFIAGLELSDEMPWASSSILEHAWAMLEPCEGEAELAFSVLQIHRCLEGLEGLEGSSSNFQKHSKLSVVVFVFVGHRFLMCYTAAELHAFWGKINLRVWFLWFALSDGLGCVCWCWSWQLRCGTGWRQWISMDKQSSWHSLNPRSFAMASSLESKLLVQTSQITSRCCKWRYW